MAQPEQTTAEINSAIHEKSQLPYGDINSQSTGIEALPSIDDEGESRMNKEKWLALFALGAAYMTAVQQGACIGMIVKSIDIALGPTTYYNWLLSASHITSTISLPLAGGLSDIFGRRWFMISGGLIHTTSAIVALAAQDIPTMIASALIAGLGSGALMLSLAAVAELVPNNKRGVVQACLDLVGLPWIVFGALTGGAMVVYHGKYGFRINFIIGIILNVLSTVTLYFFYHPPSTGKRLEGRTKWQALKALDWTGLLLLNVGVVLFLVSLSLGGATFPWRHAGVIAPLTISIVFFIAFAIWEAKLAKDPFFEHSLFKGQGRKFSLFLVISFFLGGVSAAVGFWAQAVRGLWNGDPIKVGILCIPGGMGAAIGGFAAGILIGKSKLFSTKNCLIYATGIKIISDFMISRLEPYGTYSEPWGLGFGFMSMLGSGFASVSLLVSVQLSCMDKDLGLATLLLSTAASIGSATLITVYSTIINHDLKKYAGLKVFKAVAPLGYYEPKKIKPLIYMLINENIQGAAALPGITPQILKAARDALKYVWAGAFRKVYMTAGACVATAFIVALVSKDVSHMMTNHVSPWSKAMK
ncbi:Neutral ceramidase B [Venturia nashicola]|nr:Neutral ceramidase B [Venturia nashicola]